MKRILLLALLVAALAGMTTGTAYASHTAQLQIDVQSVKIQKDGSALVRVRAKCTPSHSADKYYLQPDIFLFDPSADLLNSYYDPTGVGPASCDGKWQRYAKILPHQGGAPVLRKRQNVDAIVYYQLYPQGYDQCHDHSCNLYDFGTHDQMVRVH